jgi:hypothetical protein
MPPALFWPLLPLHLAATALVVSLHVAQGRGLSSWKGLLAGLRGLGPIWRSRRILQKARTASTMEIARALAWRPHVLIGRRAVIRPLSEQQRKS